jgi:hypothetical protein
MSIVKAQTDTRVGLYRTFERSLENNNEYSNKFSDVELTCSYISPSGDTTDFFGFFDGDGSGGGNLTTGNTWKIRFIPTEVGQWKYIWEWSDTTSGGDDTFICDSAGAGKGILRAYEENPRWLAYNGSDPVWLKSYYESGHGAIAQPFDWITENVYQPMIDRGYNHFQVNWLLSLCCFHQYYTDGPARSTSNLTLYQNGKASSTMRLDVWHLMEQNVSWLNDRNIGLFMFLGFDGGRNGGPAWTSLSASEKDFYVRYVLARLAPYANISWNYVWEVPGDREAEELGWARIVKQYDVFDHLRAYQDEQPKYNEFHRPEYNFAGVENHRINSDNREPQYWSAPWTHHEACLMGYVPGKPVFMVEGNALWRRYWAAKIKKETGRYPTLAEFRQSAWACATAAASFTWCGHHGEGSLKAFGADGLPFYGDVNPYSTSAMEVDIMADVMNTELRFYSMTPSDSLLSGHNTRKVWCLSEPGSQYLVFSAEGSPFELRLSAGQYNSNRWINTKTGAGVSIDNITATDNEIISFSPPNTDTDWILLIRTEWEELAREESMILSAETDTSGLKVFVACNHKMIIPDDYIFGFKLYAEGSSSALSIASIAAEAGDSSLVIIELEDPVIKDRDILLSYSGTLMSTGSTVLAPVSGLPVENNSKAEAVGGTGTDKEMNYSISPNPCSEHIDIRSHDGIDRIQIVDISGKLVFEKEYLTQTRINISTGDLQPGVYFVGFSSDHGCEFGRIIKE